MLASAEWFATFFYSFLPHPFRLNMFHFIEKIQSSFHVTLAHVASFEFVPKLEVTRTKSMLSRWFVPI